jgi:nucleotide-binding universal stress UspA family protein
MEKLRPEVILCPTDFSEMASFALKYGKILAAGFGARLIVLYAESFMPPPYFTPGQEDEILATLERSKKAAAAHLSRYVKEQGMGKDTQTLVVDQPPGPAILQTADQHDAWIVMGTHGRSGWNRFMMGSVAERVLHETNQPVLTVRYKKGAPEPSAISIRQVFCPVNFTQVARHALEYAVTVAESFAAELMVLKVVEPVSDPASDEGAMDQLCAWIPNEVRARCNLKEIIRRGDAAEEIITAASSSRCDMIVLGAQHRSFFDTTVIGTTTVHVTRHAPCPVLTVIRK